MTAQLGLCASESVALVDQKATDALSSVDGKLCTPRAWWQDRSSPATVSVVPAAIPPRGTALRLDYRFEGKTGERVLLNSPDLHVQDTHACVSFHVHGDASMNTLVFFIVDSGGEYHSYKEVPIDWVDWRWLSVCLLTGFRSHWGGNRTRTVDFPVREAGFVLWREVEARKLEGRLHFADLHFQTPTQAALGDVEDVEWLCRRIREDLADASVGVRRRLGKVVSVTSARLDQVRQALNRGQETLGDVRRETGVLRRRCRFVGAWLATHSAAEVRGPRSLAKPAIVAPVSAFEKVLPDELPSLAESALRLEAARGEWAAAQVVVAALDERIENVTLRFTALRHESGAALPEDALVWNPVGCVEVRRGGAQDCEKRLWPDALLPAMAVSIQAFTSQAFWITARVSLDAKAGTYTGVVELLIDGDHEATVEIALRVYDFALPRKCHLKTLFGLDTRNIGVSYGRDDLTDDEYLRWARFLLERRIHGDRLVGSYHWTQEPEKCMAPSPSAIIDAQLERFDLLWCARVTNTLLPRKADERLKVEQMLLARLPGIVEQLRKQGILDCAYLYTYDELTAAHYEQVLPFLAACRHAAPSLKVVLPFFRDNPVDSLGAYVDVWCPHFHWVAKNLETVRSLQRSGAEVWWYFTDGKDPFPNVAVDAPTLSHRVIFWLTFHFGFTGLLHWETCYWGPSMNDEQAWPERRWVASVFDHETGQYIYHGNGLLLYPGPDTRPLSSIRLETLRKGAEDFEYLWLLRERIRSGKMPAKLRARAERLLDLSDLIQDVTHYEEDVNQYEARRRAIGEVLEQAEEYRQGGERGFVRVGSLLPSV